MIKKSGNKYLLYTKDGSRVLGRHTSHKEAEAQEQAIQASKARQRRKK